MNYEVISVPDIDMEMVTGKIYYDYYTNHNAEILTIEATHPVEIASPLYVRAQVREISMIIK